MLDDNQNVHDIAALLKEFFRDMKDSLLPDDLYMSFLLTASKSSALPCWGKVGKCQRSRGLVTSNADMGPPRT